MCHMLYRLVYFKYPIVPQTSKTWSCSAALQGCLIFKVALQH